MKKTFTKFMLLLFALVVGISSMWAEDVEVTGSYSFTTSGCSGWTTDNAGSYCGGYGRNKAGGYYVANKSISNFSNVNFNIVTNQSVTIYVKALTNGGDNTYTVSLINSNGSVVGTSVTKNNGMGSGSNASSASESYVTLTPVAGTAGYRIDFPAKSAITQTRYTLTYTTVSTPYVSITTTPITVTSAGTNGDVSLDITHNLTVSSTSNFGYTFYAVDGTTALTGSDIPAWVGQSISGNNTDGYKLNYNITSYSGETDRVARLKVWGMSNDSEEKVYSDLLTIKQTAKHAVTFSLAGGTFTSNSDFSDVSVDKESGTYHLPSATKTGYAFDGWNDGSNTFAANAEYTISADVIFNAQWRELATYTLITDASQIEPGKHYIIASSMTVNDENAKAMGSQGDNNRTAVPVSVSTISTKTKITEATGMYEFVISGPEVVTIDNKEYKYYTIFDESINKYLYAAGSGSGKNYLRSQDAINGNSKWTITFADSKAIITAQGSNTNNKLRKNSSSALFSCYSTDQSPIYLYKKDTDPSTTYYSQTELSVADLNSTLTPTTVLKNEILTLTGTVTCNNAANLVVKEGGQLIIPAAKADPVKATFQREIEGYTNTKDNYYLIASPVVNDITLTEGSGMLTANYDLYYFTNTTPGVEWRNNKVEHFNKLENSKGYLYANSSDKIIEFPGTVPTATTAGITLNYNSSNTKYAGFNLVGNPLSVNITSMYLNSSACGYYYLSSTGVFTAVTAANVSSNPVIVGQAFMVQASDADHCSLTLNASSVSKGEDVYNDEVIRLEVSNNKYTDVAYLCFGNSMPLTKINHINNEAPMLYIHTESDDQAVAVMNERAEVKTVNVNFEAKTMGMYTISGKAERGNFIYMHLYDRLTGIDTDLLESDYTFIGSTNDAAGRFILHFEAIDYNADNESFAYQNGSDIIVNGEGELQIFDVMGRMVSTQQINGVERINVQSQGVYIFRLNEKTQKIVVR